MTELIVLEIPFVWHGAYQTGTRPVNPRTIHPVAVKTDTSLTLVDCGYIGSLPLLEKAMLDKGLDCANLTHVVLTHQHHDHTGALRALKNLYPDVAVATGRNEAPYISGDVPFRGLNSAQLERTYPDKTVREAFSQSYADTLSALSPVPVDIRLPEGGFLPWCAACTIIDTPGHTPGYISLFIPESRTLIAGDAASFESGTLATANPLFAFDIEQAQRSLDKVKGLRAKTIICYHGGEVH